MSSTASNIEFTLNIDRTPARIEFLKEAVPEDSLPLLDQFVAHGSISAPRSDNEFLNKARRLELANSLAEVTGNNLVLTKGLLADDAITSLRDVALTYNDERLKELFHPGSAAPQMPIGIGTIRAVQTSVATPPDFTPVQDVQNHLFNVETSAFVIRMLEDGKLSPNPPDSANSKSTIVGNSVAGPQSKAKSLLVVNNPGSTQSHSDASVNAMDNPITNGLIKVLKSNPNYNFRQHPISSVLSNPGSFADVPDDSKEHVENALKDLQLAQAVTPVPQALPTLFRSKLSARRIAQLPEQQFLDNFGPSLGGKDIAKNIHEHAVRATSRNDHALISILQSARGTGIAAIDGPESAQERRQRVLQTVADMPEQINLEKLFGSLDYCECSDCTSVTSPAAYFVELMQFLRNNDLNPNTPWSEWSNSQDFSYSPLDYLLRRRPDLACLELTCANTNLVLPYIDLANEVMESFIVYQVKFFSSTTQPKQSWISIFNAADNADGLGGSTEELLAVPQNVNQSAYQILHESVYPATTLPYNQPVDAARQFLTFLTTSRAEITRIFQSIYSPPIMTSSDAWATVICPNPRLTAPSPCGADTNAEDCDDDTSDSSSASDIQDSYGAGEATGDAEADSSDDDVTNYQNGGASNRPLTPEEQASLTKIYEDALQDAVAAEELNITQEEYIILTKQAFWRKTWFDIHHDEEVSTATYRKRIGVKKDWEYWGLDYSSLADMQDSKNGTGLAFVKAQLLPRTGILYSDLVDILRTNFINPNMPKGRAKVIMESFQFSYQFLASKIDTAHKHRKSRLKKLLEFIEKPTDQDADFAQVLKDSLKRTSCCQLLYENRQPPRKELMIKQTTTADTAVPSTKKHKSGKCQCGCDNELKDWICQYFEAVGKVIVLDSGEGQKLPWEADIFEYTPPVGILHLTKSALPTPVVTPAVTPAVGEPGETLIGHVQQDGSITLDATSTTVVGFVSLAGIVYKSDGKTLFNEGRFKNVIIRRTDKPTGNTSDGSIDSSSVLHIDGITTATPWTVTYDDCDLTKGKFATSRAYGIATDSFFSETPTTGWKDCGTPGL